MSEHYRELLIGGGARRRKLLHRPQQPDWNELTVLDVNPEHAPDVVWDLTRLPLPFDDERFDEIHAYEVLEHTGQQGATAGGTFRYILQAVKPSRITRD